MKYVTFAVVFVSKLEIANVLSILNEANRINYFAGCCQRGPLAIAGPVSAESVTAAVVAKAAQN